MGYKSDIEHMAAIEKAEVISECGAGGHRWRNYDSTVDEYFCLYISRPDITVVDCARRSQDQYISAEVLFKSNTQLGVQEESTSRKRYVCSGEPKKDCARFMKSVGTIE